MYGACMVDAGWQQGVLSVSAWWAVEPAETTAQGSHLPTVQSQRPSTPCFLLALQGVRTYPQPSQVFLCKDPILPSHDEQLGGLPPPKPRLFTTPKT